MKKKLLALLMACVLAVSSGTVLQPVTTYAATDDENPFRNNDATFAKSRSKTTNIKNWTYLFVTLKTNDKVTVTVKTKNGKKTNLGIMLGDEETVLVKEKKRSKMTYTYKPTDKQLTLLITSDSKAKKVKVTIKSKNKKADIGDDMVVGPY